MAQYTTAMPQFMNAAHQHDVHQQQHNHHITANDADPRMSQQQPIIHVVGDVRPRLTKEQHDILEAHFQHQNKPSTNTKKGFAEQLGVPLDKINNWFQNRRAKVKQDAKKQANAINMFQQQIAMAQLNNQPPPQPHEFFAANPHLDSSGFHSAIPQSFDANMPNYATQQQPHHHPMMNALSAPSDSHNPAATTTDETVHGLQHPAYTFEQVDLANIASGSFMAFDGSEQYSMFQPPFAMANIQDFAPSSFTNMTGATDGYGMQHYAAAPMQATPSTGSTPSTMGSVQSSTVANSMGNMSVPTVSTEWADEPKPLIHFSMASGDVTQNAYCSPPEEQTGMWTRPAQAGFEQTSPGDTTRPASAQGLPTPPTQADQTAQFSLREESLDALTRRPSFPVGLVESIGNVDIHSRANSTDGDEELSRSSSIAARRQRPRPAAIGQAALRSASYSAGIPASPGAGNSLNPPEQTLRRIRSSGLPGMAHGRIQKPGMASGQRSPLGMNFADAASSPKFARHVSYANVTSPGQTTLAPPTPLTPNDAARFPSWQSHGGSAQSVDHGSPNGIAASWTSESSALYPSHVTSSPPETPLDTDQALRYQAYMQSMQPFRDTPPQSAPATQQAFGITMGPPALPDGLTLNPAQMGHFRRTSLQEGAHMMQQPVPMFHGQVTDLSMAYHPVPYEHLQIPQPNVTVPTQSMSAFPTPPQPTPGSVNTQAGAVLPANFAVHEYTPPSSDGSKGVSPGSAFTRLPFGEVSKTYHFANSGPKDYKEQDVA